jgi:co-chaperonin GroES (HSP10)
VIRPLGNRVLVKPDPQVKETASGLAIPDAHFEYDMSGTVVQVGNGPASAHRVREAMIARFHKCVDDAADEWDDGETGESLLVAADLHRKLNALAALNVSELQVGDHVAFPYTAGTLIEVDGERYLLMNEDQIVAVLEAAAA